jgi:hypothetical protein
MEGTSPLKWLGVYFNYKLSFKQHVQILSKRALTVTNALKSLGKMTCRVPPLLLQQAIMACVLKKGYFAAKTWWPGRTQWTAMGHISN